MLICNGCNGFAGDGDETAAELVTATLSADPPCKTWNVILTFVLGNRSVHLAIKHAKHADVSSMTIQLNWQKQ